MSEVYFNIQICEVSVIKARWSLHLYALATQLVKFSTTAKSWYHLTKVLTSSGYSNHHLGVTTGLCVLKFHIKTGLSRAKSTSCPGLNSSFISRSGPCQCFSNRSGPCQYCSVEFWDLL